MLKQVKQEHITGMYSIKPGKQEKLSEWQQTQHKILQLLIHDFSKTMNKCIKLIVPKVIEHKQDNLNKAHYYAINVLGDISRYDY